MPERLRARPVGVPDQPPVHPVVAGAGAGDDDCRSRLPQPAGLHEAHPFVVDAHGPRRVRDAPLALDDQDVDAGLAKEVGDGQPRRPRAGDEHLGPVLHAAGR